MLGGGAREIYAARREGGGDARRSLRRAREGARAVPVPRDARVHEPNLLRRSVEDAEQAEVVLSGCSADGHIGDDVAADEFAGEGRGRSSDGRPVPVGPEVEGGEEFVACAGVGSAAHRGAAGSGQLVGEGVRETPGVRWGVDRPVRVEVVAHCVELRAIADVDQAVVVVVVVGGHSHGEGVGSRRRAVGGGDFDLERGGARRGERDLMAIHARVGVGLRRVRGIQMVDLRAGRGGRGDGEVARAGARGGRVGRGSGSERRAERERRAHARDGVGCGRAGADRDGAEVGALERELRLRIVPSRLQHGILRRRPEAPSVVDAGDAVNVLIIPLLVDARRSILERRLQDGGGSRRPFPCCSDSRGLRVVVGVSDAVGVAGASVQAVRRGRRRPCHCPDGVRGVDASGAIDAPGHAAGSVRDAARSGDFGG